jgi:beta-glucosidase
VTPTESGLYRFSLLQAGLATLWVDGQRVGPGYREGVQFLAGPRYPMQAAVRLTAGKPASIRIDYSSSAQLFGAQVHLAWQPPSASGIPAAVEAARHADAAIVLANNGQGEGMDRTTLALPGDQDQLIDAVAAVNRRTIVVLDTGGPVLMPWLHHVEGVLQAWYPGQQFGAALATVLFGDSDPGGRLPITFPASDAQGPAPPTRPERYPGANGAQHYDEGILVGYRWYQASGEQPLFPFGSGLSYTTFAYSGVTATPQSSGGKRRVRVSFDVSNTGARAGADVAQVYLGLPAAAGEPPRRLAGFEKVRLAPGETRHITVTLRTDSHPLSFWDDAAGGWATAAGDYAVYVGDSSDSPLATIFHVAPVHPGT